MSTEEMDQSLHLAACFEVQLSNSDTRDGVSETKKKATKNASKSLLKFTTSLHATKSRIAQQCGGSFPPFCRELSCPKSILQTIPCCNYRRKPWELLLLDKSIEAPPRPSRIRNIRSQNLEGFNQPKCDSSSRTNLMRRS